MKVRLSAAAVVGGVALTRQRKLIISPSMLVHGEPLMGASAECAADRRLGGVAAVVGGGGGVAPYLSHKNRRLSETSGVCGSDTSAL